MRTWLYFCLTALVCCGEPNLTEDELQRAIRSGFVIDTLLLGHPVHLSMDMPALRRDTMNQLRIVIDGIAMSDWALFTITRQATITMDTVTKSFQVTPTSSTDSVMIHFRLPEANEYGGGNPTVFVPVE